MEDKMKSFAIKLLAAAGFSLAVAMAAAPAAEAKVSVHIGIGVGTWYGPGYYGGYWRDKLTCREGRWLVQSYGYRYVRALDCAGRYYTYRGWRRGHPVLVRVDAINARVVGTQRD